MSTADRLAKLEAQAWANTQKIEELSTQKHKLTIENSRQEELIAKYQQDFKPFKPKSHHALVTLQESPESKTSLQYEPMTHILFPPPGPLPTPFYIASREACQLEIAFVVPGLKGETLEVAVNKVDLAFVLQQTLKRREWNDARTRNGVEDFLERPMMKITWRGKAGEFGVLP
ncbi:uncharacterized protein K460DRAFT_411017 [Cucurbitaria berberidis CBS 394.84]|uniref:Uncharacterized protein n=1 Tax=Cucurbitaria berberidis CBS 394.84 TaxID=1168544 RepID=A0A9P4G7I1_9PLEO|nr:uncharacterized protein K460DRAFT_411017 [Cucurbitaria berberidis CBS 394.84]KAF1840434.1 hypothetical protein K460DRAFT_411017 [Cucurbitaria berberidis CBS 394.84]